MKHRNGLRLILALAVIALLTAVCTAALADGSGSCGTNATWELKSGVLTITGSGAVTVSPWATQSEAYGPKDVTSAKVGEGITSLPGYAFYSCENMKSISLPSTLEEMKDGVFIYCKVLESISIPQKVKAIGDSSFWGCSALKNVALPGGLETIGESAFRYCTSLKTLSLPETMKSIGDNAFDGCRVLEGITIPAGQKVLGQGMFKDCKGLTSLTIPEGVTGIGKNCFNGCTGLQTITVPATVTSIGGQAFASFNGTVNFQGDAPTLADDVFKNAYVICTYPKDAAGWAGPIQREYTAKWILWEEAGSHSGPGEDPDKDPTETLESEKTKNEGSEDYVSVWNGGMVDSYLTQLKDGSYQRVENTGSEVVVEQYTAGMKLVWKKKLAMELPKWGGYYHGTDYNFLVFGQNNDEEDNSKEIMRIVKYSANWHRIDGTSVYGANTVHPFAYGSLRMTQSGDYLFIHTCHEMYADANGTHHQANMNYKLHIPTMSLIVENYTVGNESGDYISHSFNQFVIADGNDIVKLDHGDKYDRGMIVSKLTGAATTPGTGTNNRTSVLDFIEVDGRQYQDTGATAGGLEASTSCYLVAGKTIDQNVGIGNRDNIFISVVPKDQINKAAVSFRWITTYTTPKPYLTNPLLIKINGAQFLLMWTEASKKGASDAVLRYMFLDEKGTSTTEIYSAAATLSDCQPTVGNGQVTWYVTKDTEATFYCIDLDNPSVVVKLHCAGWVDESGKQVYYGEDARRANGLTKTVDNQWYFFINGYAQSGWRNLEEGTYYFEPAAICNAVREIGTLEDPNVKKMFGFDENGKLALLGDVNEDGVVDGRDSIRLMKVLSGEEDEAGQIMTTKIWLADLNGDGVINELDLLRLMKMLTE